MTNFFQFEADFVDSLHCIPMQVRYKLDTCGIKLKLAHWNHFTQAERENLVEMPCTTGEEIQAYREYLQQLVLQNTGTRADDIAVESHPAWIDGTNVPANVEQKVREFGVTLMPQQWADLTPLQRFALIKLSRSSHENDNFLPAMKEFNLI